MSFGDSIRPQVRTAVIPAAGLGTRFLPATKAVPKEMLPVVDRPAIEYVVAEAVAAGLDDILLVSSRSKKSVEDHFDEAPEVEEALRRKGNHAMLARVHEATGLARVHSTRQVQPRGLGHAVLCAADHVGDAPFAVLLGDDLVDPRDPLLQPMIEVQRRHGGSVVALMRVPREQVSLYGVASVETVEDPVDAELRVTGLVEKPPVEEAPSDLIVIGRYVLAPEIFDVLRATPPGRGGEIQLTDALQTMASLPADKGGGVHGVIFEGRRYDTGDKADYLRTIVRLAVEREDLGPEFAGWLRSFVGSMPEQPWRS